MDLEKQQMLPVNLPDEKLTPEQVSERLKPIIDSLEKDIKKERSENSYYAIDPEDIKL